MTTAKRPAFNCFTFTCRRPPVDGMDGLSSNYVVPNLDVEEARMAVLKVCAQQGFTDVEIDDHWVLDPEVIEAIIDNDGIDGDGEQHDIDDLKEELEIYAYAAKHGVPVRLQAYVFPYDVEEDESESDATADDMVRGRRTLELVRQQADGEDWVFEFISDDEPGVHVMFKAMGVSKLRHLGWDESFQWGLNPPGDDALLCREDGLYILYSYDDVFCFRASTVVILRVPPKSNR